MAPNSTLTTLTLYPTPAADANPEGMTLLLTQLHAALDPDEVVSLELVGRVGTVRFQIVLPTRHATTVTAWLSSYLPGILVTRAPGWRPPSAQGRRGLRSLALCRDSENFSKTEEDRLFPLRRPTAPTQDPISGLVSVAGALRDAEVLWMQMLLSPAPYAWVHALQECYRSYPLHQYLDTNHGGLDLLRDAYRVKLFGPLWGATIRTRVTASSSARTEAILAAVHGYFNAFNQPNGARFDVRLSKNFDAMIRRQHWTSRRETQEHGPVDYPQIMLTPEEAAALWHLPACPGRFPSLETANATLLPASAVLRQSGLERLELGHGWTGQDWTPLYCDPADLDCHWYVRGLTGSGKTTLIVQQVQEALRSQRYTVVVITPKPGEARAFLGGLDPETAARVLLLDQTDQDYPFAFNILDLETGEDPYLVGEQVVSVFQKLYAAAWGWETERVLRYVTQTLLACPERSLLLASRLLTDPTFRADVVSRLEDRELRRYWEQEYAHYGERLRQQKTAPALNKLAALTTNPHLRAILGPAHSSFSWRELLESGQLILVQLDARQDLAAHLLGALIIGRIQLMARARSGHQEHRPVLLFVDEFHHFTTAALPQILTEARAAGLYLRLIHQHRRQVDPALLSAILANCATQFYFRDSAAGADEAVAELLGQVRRDDVVGQDRYRAYVKFEHGGVVLPIFSLTTLPPPPVDEAVWEQVRAHSRAQVGRPRAQALQDAAAVTVMLDRPKGRIRRQSEG